MFGSSFCLECRHPCNENFKLRLVAGSKVMQPVLLDSGGSTYIDCLQGKDGCTDLSIEVLSSAGQRTGKFVQDGVVKSTGSSSFTGGPAGGGMSSDNNEDWQEALLTACTPTLTAPSCRANCRKPALDEGGPHGRCSM